MNEPEPKSIEVIRYEDGEYITREFAPDEEEEARAHYQECHTAAFMKRY